MSSISSIWARNPLERLAMNSLLAVLFVTLVFPMALGGVKFALFGCFVICSLILGVRLPEPQLAIDRSVLTLFFLIIGTNGFFVFYGALNGASPVATVETFFIYIVYPIFYLGLAFLSSSLLDFQLLTRVLLWASGAISYITILQVQRALGFEVLPGYSLLHILYPGLANGYVDYSFTGELGFLPRSAERLIFLAPFSVAAWGARKALKLPTFLATLNLLLVFAATVTTARRATLLVFGLAAAAMFLLQFLRRPRRFVLLGTTYVVIVSLAFAILMSVQTDSGFSGSSQDLEESYISRDITNLDFGLRAEQLRRILQEAEQNPLLGRGFGHPMSGYVRDATHPWRVELTYFALLFQTGVVGVLLYLVIAGALARIAVTSVSRIGMPLVPYVFGMCGALLAAATNPYLNYGTGQWVMFLPIAVFNAVLVTRYGIADNAFRFAVPTNLSRDQLVAKRDVPAPGFGN